LVTVEEVSILFTGNASQLQQTVNQLKASIKQLEMDSKKADTTLSKMNINTQIKTETELVKKKLQEINKVKLNQIKQAVSNLKAGLLGLGMSSLFLGMQVAAAFTSIARGAVDAFLKIRASAGPTNDAISMLGASINFLQFAIGDAIASALEPFLPMIMGIIENVVEWVSQNKELTASIIIGGIALGTLMLLGGQFLILASSMIAVVQFFANVLGITGLSGALTNLSFAEATSGLILLIGKLIIAAAAIVIIYNIIQSAIKGFDSFNKTSKKTPDILSKIASVLGLVANALSTAGAFLALGALSIGVILAFLVREAQYRIGQFAKILSAGAEVAINSLKSIVILGLNGILGTLETFIKLAEAPVNAFIRLINTLIAAWNAVSGNKIKPLEYADFSDLNIGRIEQDNVALVDSFIKLKSAMDGMGDSGNLTWLNNKLADFKGLFDQSMSDIWNPKSDLAIGTDSLQSSNETLTTSIDSLTSTISATTISNANQTQSALNAGGTITIGTMEVSLPNITDAEGFTNELKDMQSDLELKSNGITES